VAAVKNTAAQLTVQAHAVVIQLPAKTQRLREVEPQNSVPVPAPELAAPPAEVKNKN